MTLQPAREMVSGFLATLAHYAQTLAGPWGIHPGKRVLREFVETAWTGGRARTGRVGDLDYLVHGRMGLRLQAPEGGSVDVDVLSDGRATFDAWRVQQFAVSLGQPEPEAAEIETVCEELVSSGALRRERPHWYAAEVAGGE